MPGPNPCCSLDSGRGGSWRPGSVGPGRPDCGYDDARHGSRLGCAVVARDQLHRVCPVMQPSLAESGYRWEWHLSLARNLLRCTYHSDIPHAKRALAFAAAYDQLNAAAETLPS